MGFRISYILIEFINNTVVKNNCRIVGSCLSSGTGRSE